MCTLERANSIQIIVTDNIGHEFPEMNNSPWSSLTILRNERKMGFASNHNRAFQFAKGKYFCVLNPDILFEQEVFSSLIELLESKQADIVSPLIVDRNSNPQDSLRKFPTPFEIIWRRLPGYRFILPFENVAGLVKPDWIAGMFMFMSSETYHAIKGFDERYRLYFEDVDFCARAQLAGFKIIVDSNIRIQHNAHRASRKNLLYLFWHLQSAIRFFTSPTYKKAVQKTY
jgi:GT2 family glycosyltransferase